MRALVIAAFLSACGCSRASVAIRADDAHVDAPPVPKAPDACDRMLGSWTMEYPGSLRSLELVVGEIIQRIGQEATREDRVRYQVLERTADFCRIRTQAGDVMTMVPFEPGKLRIEQPPGLSRWVRAEEPLPSSK
ncbi:MAG: hypothetical protein ACXWUG_19330 [Polyangiales bacterium]